MSQKIAQPDVKRANDVNGAYAMIGTSVDDLQSSLRCAEISGRLEQLEPTLCVAYKLCIDGGQKTKAGICKRFLKKIEREGFSRESEAHHGG